MKLTTKQLKQIIAEELRGVLRESDRGPGYGMWDGKLLRFQ